MGNCNTSDFVDLSDSKPLIDGMRRESIPTVENSLPYKRNSLSEPKKNVNSIEELRKRRQEKVRKEKELSMIDTPHGAEAIAENEVEHKLPSPSAA